MRNVNVGILAVLLVGLSAQAASAAASEQIIRYEWRFNTEASLAPADTGPGDAVAAVAPGSFGSGWLKDLPALSGGAGGYWDLGQAGRIVCSFPKGMGQGGLVRSIKVEVVQWWDGSIFGGFADLWMPGAEQAATGANIDRLGSVGGWVADQTVWTPAPGARLESLTLASGESGAVIDSVVVEAIVEAMAPPVLTIVANPASGQVQISWPAGYSEMVLESSTDMSNAKGWQKVDAAVQVGPDSCSVTAAADGPVRFYRLRQP